jgi:hypothetical protein
LLLEHFHLHLFPTTHVPASSRTTSTLLFVA